MLVVSSGRQSYDRAVLTPALLVYALLSLAAGALYAFDGGHPTAVWAFRCIALAAVVFVGGWLAAV